MLQNARNFWTLLLISLASLLLNCASYQLNPPTIEQCMLVRLEGVPSDAPDSRKFALQCRDDRQVWNKRKYIRPLQDSVGLRADYWCTPLQDRFDEVTWWNKKIWEYRTFGVPQTP